MNLTTKLNSVPVTRLVAALHWERRQPLRRVQLAQGTQLPQVAEPGHGLGAGVEEGEHDAGLLLVVAVRKDNAVPVVGHLDERAEVVRLEPAVQEYAEIRRVSAEENSDLYKLSIQSKSRLSKNLGYFDYDMHPYLVSSSVPDTAGKIKCLDSIGGLATSAMVKNPRTSIVSEIVASTTSKSLVSL